MGSDLQTPETIAELTPEWLTLALRAGGVIGAGDTVTAAAHEALGAGSGFVGQLARVHVTYDHRPADAPDTLIAKLPGLDPGARAIAALYGLYELEFRFYSELAEQVSFRTARCFYAAGDAASVRYILLLEDMAATGAIGDQVKGCTLEQARAALRHLAAHHAVWWDDARLDEIGWLQPGVDLVAGAMAQSYPACHERTAELFGDKMPARIREAIPSLGGQVLALLETLRESASTLTHGDYRLDNMFFGNAGSGYELAVLDWQSPNKGWGAYDVAYFLYSNLDVKTRREHEDAMLQDYHAALVAGGVRDYSFEQLQDDYVMSMLVSLAIWVINAATLDTANERGVALFDLFFERLSAAILDLGALDRIPGA